MTSETKVKIVRAAIDAISRYGVRRTSMADVSAAAGVSRQTLYDNFSSKDDLLAAAMMTASDDMMAELNAQWDGAATIGEVLDAYFEYAVYKPFEVMQRLPDVRDLLLGADGMSGETIRALFAQKTTALTERLAPFNTKMAAFDTNAHAVAELVTRSTTDFKNSAADLEELRRLMTTLKASIVALGS